MRLFYSIFLLLSLTATLVGEKRDEGLFGPWHMRRSLEVLGFFLPYNPTIMLLGADIETLSACKEAWPLANLITREEGLASAKVDLLWLHNRSSAPLIKKPDHMKSLAALYITSSTSLDIAKDRFFPLIFSAKWYDEQKNQSGTFFLNPESYQGFLRSLSFHFEGNSPRLPRFPDPRLDRFFSRIEEKVADHSFSSIDWVYMINLDERPEKFAASLAALTPYEIYPCRLPAVNGHTLPQEVLDEVGLKWDRRMMGHIYMGLRFQTIEGKPYKLLEFMKEEGTPYFCAGMTKGAIGIVLSHLSVLQDAYLSGYRTIWVMEDDIEVLEDPRQIPSLLAELDAIDPEWDIFFTDKDSKDSSGQHVPCRALAMRPDLRILPLSHFLEKCYSINDTFCRVGMRYGAYSMIIRRSGIKKILGYYKQHAIFLPYDADFWLNPSLRMYGLNRDLVSTLPNAHTDNYQAGYKK